MFFKLIYSCVPFLLCTGVFGEVAETSAVNVEELSCPFTNSKCSWYSKGGSPGLLWTLSDSSTQQRIPAPDGRDGFLMLETDSEEQELDMIWSPKFKVRSEFVNLSMSVYCTEEADIELQMVVYKEGAPPRGSHVANIGSMVQKNTWQSIINLSLDEDFEDFEDKEYQMFLQGRIRKGGIIAIRNVQLQEIPATFVVTETSIPTERSDTTEEALSIVTTTDYSSTAKVETCHEYRLQARPVEEISCSFQDSECCWYSEGGSPGISWKLSNSSAESAISKPNAGSGFLMLSSDDEERKMDMIWSPKFTVPTESVTLTISVFATQSTSIHLYLIKYENDNFQGNLVLDITERIKKNSWSEVINYELKEDFEDYEGKVYQLFIQGDVSSNAFVAIKNLVLKSNVVFVSTSDPVTDIATTPDINVRVTSSPPADTSSAPIETCKEYRSKFRSLEEVSCSFEDSVCCWYSEGGSSNEQWTLSDSSKSPEVPTPVNGFGYLLLNSNSEEPVLDILWSPKFAVSSRHVKLSFDVFYTEDSDFEVYLLKNASANNAQSIDNKLLLDIEDEAAKNSWESIINYNLEDAFDEYNDGTYQIYLKGKAEAGQYVAVKNLRLQYEE